MATERFPLHSWKLVNRASWPNRFTASSFRRASLTTSGAAVSIARDEFFGVVLVGGDPEGRLTGGKLLRGGLLMRGVLIGHN